MLRAEADFAHRAHLQEWMDQPCSYEDFRDCLRDLALLNRVTFTHRPTLQWLKRFPADVPLHILDVGCGGGDMLRHIEGVAAREKRTLRLTGVDLNPYAARAAREFTASESRIEWLTGDTFSVPVASPVDVVISSLFTHHLTEDEIVHFVRWMERTAVRGWFINDLHRGALPYYALQVIPRLMRAHRFVRHDAPVSILRAFRKDEWQRYLEAAGVPAGAAVLETLRPARLCVSRMKP